MKLIIGSVYYGNWEWYPVQLKFLKLTTINYRFFVTSEDKPPYPDCEWIPKKSSSHLEGIKKIFEEFQRSDADYCILMDSDAFPIRKDWAEMLSSNLIKFNKKYAAPFRTENGDVFPHVSFLFLNRKDIDLIMLTATNYGSKCFNLLGNDRCDIGSGLPKDLVFPLLKSNKFSPNTCFHTIYYDLIYHCGCGSRSVNMTFFNYWKIIRPKDFNFEIDSKFISKVDEAFINKLLGERRFQELSLL